MGTPLWQFWTDWTVKALGTLATVLAVFVALFGSRLRHWLDPPKLVISLASAEGFPAVRYIINLKTNEAEHQTNGFWYHVRVDNKNRSTPATGVHIFLLLIEVPDASGDFKPVWNGYAKIGWRNDHNPEPKNIGYHAECDLCYVLSDPREIGLSPIIRGQVAPETFQATPQTSTRPIRIAMELQARGIESESKVLRVEISWDGEWSEDVAQMKRHFVVKVP
jgi:hypothetical protein